METFKSYLDKIKAEESLKEQTKAFVRNSNITQSRITKRTFLDSFFNLKRLAVAATVLVVCAAFSLGAYAYTTPANYISLDINPSIEIGVNAFGKVASVEGINEDGDSLLLDHKLIGLPLEKAMDILVEAAADQGFIAGDGSTVIAITVETLDDEDVKELGELAANGVNLAMSNKNIIAAVYQDCSDPQLRDEAQKLDVSPGKYKLLMLLQTLDPGLDITDYKDAKVSEIIGLANDIINNGLSSEENPAEITEIIDHIQNAANQVQENKNNARQNLDQNMDKNTNGGNNTDKNLDTDNDNNDLNQNQIHERDKDRVQDGTGLMNEEQEQKTNNNVDVNNKDINKNNDGNNNDNINGNKNGNT